MLTTLAQNLKLLKQERERSREKKSKNRRFNASNNRRKRACIIFRSLGGEPDELCYEPDIYGIQQIDSVDEETLLLFTSKTDKACLRDLFDSHCFMGKLKNKVMIFALRRISSTAQLIRRLVKIDQL